MTVIVGSSNVDSTGGAQYLTEENGIVYDIYSLELVYDEDGRIGYRHIDEDGMYISEGTGWGSGYFIFENTLDWNAEGKKEFYIDQESFSHGDVLVNLSISNFVDVYIDFSEDTEYQNNRYPYRITIDDAKRGYIDLSGLDDNSDIYNPYTEGTDLVINVKSNGYSWDNTFDIIMGDGLDQVTLSGGTDSKWTNFYVEMNGGTDYFYYELETPYYSSQERYVNGGSGHDNIFFSSGQDLEELDFESFESILNADDIEFGAAGSVTLNQDILDNNGVSELIVAKFETINFSDQYDDVSINELSAQQEDLLTSQYDETETYPLFLYGYFWDRNDFYEVTITYGDQEYTILTDADKDSWV